MGEKFTSGDFVQLKSGGPKMTISGESSIRPGNFNCKWFAGSKLNQGVFAPEELQRYDEDADKKARK